MKLKRVNLTQAQIKSGKFPGAYPPGNYVEYKSPDGRLWYTREACVLTCPQCGHEQVKGDFDSNPTTCKQCNHQYDEMWNRQKRHSQVVVQDHDTDSGLGIGGISNDQSMLFIPSVHAIERIQKMHNTDTVCRRCGASKNFDGAMFTTFAGGDICDDCA